MNGYVSVADAYREQWDYFFEKQDGCCAICHVKHSVVSPLVLDHDHESQKSRGLLCSSCNTGVGCFRDNAVKLQAAIDYVSRPQANLPDYPYDPDRLRRPPREVHLDHRFVASSPKRNSSLRAFSQAVETFQDTRIQRWSRVR